MENELKRVSDVRFHPSAYTWTITQEINRVSVMMAGCFKSNIAQQQDNKMWYMPGTIILVINCANFEKEDYYLYTKKGNKKCDWISEVRIHMTEEEFVKLNEKGKMRLILDKLHDGFHKFANLFANLDFDTKAIDKSYEQILQNKFYLRCTPSYFSKDKKYECWMELCPCISGHKHQLVLKEIEKISKHFIAQDEVQIFSSPNPPVEELIAPTNSLKIIGNGWKKHKFYFKYGMPGNYSTIIFDADTKTVENVKK